MSKYLKNLMRLIEISDGNANGTMVVNKDGIVEYFWPGNRLSAMHIAGFTSDVVGKHVLDIYPELKEEESTVMQTLRTGKTIVGKEQTLRSKNYTVTLVTTTYPISENDTVEGAVDVARVLEIRRNGVTEGGSSLYSLDDIVTDNVKMKRMKEKVKDIAKNDSPVLIYGETGTGKELVAQSLHTESLRKNKPFFSQNCAAIPDNLLESIFFGTEKGSFTGAESRKGIFEAADGGTLFLDEINSMPPAMQAKLLKALEEKKIRRVGGKDDIRFDVRIICATNQRPEHLIETGIMREDLYYRISVVRIDIPPLRERPDDILLLSDYFIAYYNHKMMKNIQGLNHMVEQLFQSWSWPGNVRELKNTIESAFNIEKSSALTLESVQELLRKAGDENGAMKHNVQEKTAVDTTQFPNEPLSKAWLINAMEEESIDLEDVMKKCEASIISEVLGRETKLKDAANRLSMSPQKLQYRMEKLNLKKK